MQTQTKKTFLQFITFLTLFALISTLMVISNLTLFDSIVPVQDIITKAGILTGSKQIATLLLKGIGLALIEIPPILSYHVCPFGLARDAVLVARTV